MKVFLSENDTFNYTIYNEEEAYDMYGFNLEEDDDFFVEIPDELVCEYKEIYKKFWELNKKIDIAKKIK